MVISPCMNPLRFIRFRNVAHTGFYYSLTVLLGIAFSVAAYAQSPDHPIIPMIPETEYLKGFAFEMVR